MRKSCSDSALYFDSVEWNYEAVIRDAVRSQPNIQDETFHKKSNKTANYFPEKLYLRCFLGFE